MGEFLLFSFSLLVFTHSKLCCDSPSVIQFLPSISLYPRSHLRHNLLCPTSAKRFFPSLSHLRQSHLRQSHLRHNLLRPASFSRGLPPNIEGSPSFPIVSRSLSTPGVVYPWRCLQHTRDGPLPAGLLALLRCVPHWETRFRARFGRGKPQK